MKDDIAAINEIRRQGGHPPLTSEEEREARLEIGALSSQWQQLTPEARDRLDEIFQIETYLREVKKLADSMFEFDSDEARDAVAEWLHNDLVYEYGRRGGVGYELGPPPEAVRRFERAGLIRRRQA